MNEYEGQGNNLRITVDTNFLVSATQWDYSVCNKLFTKLILKGVEFFTTQTILDEFSEVLVRDFQYSLEESSAFIQIILSFVTIINPLEKINVIIQDPDDNAILECAVASNSEYIITYDKHLLELKEFRGIKIVKPEEMFGIIDIYSTSET